MYRRRNSNEIEDAIMSDSGTALPDRAVTNNGTSKKKKGFRKSTSAEPTAGLNGHGRKKSFTHFFNNLFSPKSNAENRLSGISIESASFESVNTILSTNSFTFVSPKKGKIKGKRIPMQQDETPKCSRRKKKLGTLTRIGMKMGLKSKYNLQSCESLHHLQNSDAAAGLRDMGTLGSTYRKKRKAPAPPAESSSSSPVVQSKQQQLAQTSEAQQGAAQDIIVKPSTSKQALKEQQEASSSQQSTSQPSEPAEPQQSAEKVSQSSIEQAENVPTVIPQSIPSPKPSTSQQKSPKVTENFDSKTFKITARHRRSSSDGTSAPQAPAAASSTHSQSATLSHTYRNKCHVRGKRKAPAPPNPFGDPDAPEEEDEEEVAPLPQPTPVPITPPNPFLDEEPGDDSTLQTNTEVSPPPPTQQQQPVAIRITNENEDEIFQNNLNEQLFQEQELQQQQQQQQQQTEPAPGPSRLSQAPSEQQLAAAQRDLQVLITVLNNDNNTPAQQQPQIKVDERTKQELVELKRESDKSPLMFLRAKSKSGSESSRSSVAEIRNSLNITTPPASPEPEYKKLTPKPWYKRATSSSGGTKKTKPLLQPLPGMTKFSDIDREANRIIEEQRRRTAEQGFHDSARELITMFNSFNESQRAPSPTPNDSSVTTTTRSVSSVAASTSVATVATSTISSSSTAAVTSSSSSTASPVSSASTAAMTVSQLLAASRPNPRSASSSVNLPNTSLTTKPSGSVATTSKIGLTTAAASISTASSARSTATATSQGQQSEEPKKLAIVRPQSSPQSKSTSTTVTTTTTSTTTSITTPTFCKYPVQRKEDWICSRCTLKNAAWRLTCEACFNRTDSSISKLSSVFESPLTGTSAASTRPSISSQSTSVTSSSRVTTSAASSTSTVTASVSSVPPCDNFLGQTKAPEVPRKEESRPEGVKLDGESGEELDIVQLRQQRLAFFQKKPPSSSEASEEDVRWELDNEPAANSGENWVATNSLVSEPGQSEGNQHHEPVNDSQNNSKLSQVFSDDEDDSIDALIGLQRTSNKIENPQDEPANAPNFGPRSWNPFQANRFRPMLESIVEQSQDVYAQLDAPYYENWEFGQGPPHAIYNENGINGQNIPWTNTFMHPEYSPTDPMFGYYYANSDSSSCSECEREQQQHQRAAEAAMDGNRTPSRRHSSHHQHHHHHMRHYSAYFPNDLPPEQKLTLEDYRRLGAVPKYLLHHPHDGGDRFSHHSGERSHRRHSSALDEHRPSPLRGSNGAEGRSDGNSAEVAKLLRRLETAIAEGDHRLAATLAHDLALLKVNCVVAKEDDMTKPITIRVYVEDRFMQQGPFQVQVTKMMTVRDVKLKIESDWSIPAAFQKWILGRKMSENDDQKLLDFEISHDDMAFLYLVTPQIAPANSQPAQPSMSTAPQPVGIRGTPAQKNVQPSQPLLPVKTVKQEPVATQVKSVKQDTASQIKSVNARAEPPPTLPPKNSSLFNQEAYQNVLAPAPVKTSVAKTQQKVVTTESLPKKVSAGVQATSPVPPATKSVKNSAELNAVKDAETKPPQSTGVPPIIPTKSVDPKLVSAGQQSAKVNQSTVNKTPSLALKSSSASNPPAAVSKSPTELKEETTQLPVAKPSAAKVTSSPSVVNPNPMELSPKVETSKPPELALKKIEPAKSPSVSRATEPAKSPSVSRATEPAKPPQGSLKIEPPKQSPAVQQENSSKLPQQSSPMQDKKTKPTSNITASVSPQVPNLSSATAAVAGTSPSSQSQKVFTKNTKSELAQPVSTSQTKLIKRSPYKLANSTKVTAATSTTTLAADSAANNVKLFHKDSNKNATKTTLLPTAENGVSSSSKSTELAVMNPPKLAADSLKVATDSPKVNAQPPSISNKSGAPIQASAEKSSSSTEPVPMKRTKKKRFDSGSSSSVTPEPPSSDVENNAKSNPDLSATKSVVAENKPVEQISSKSTQAQSAAAALPEKKQNKEEVKPLSPSLKPEKVEAGVQSTLPLPSKAVKKLQQSTPLPASAASANVSTTNVDVPGKANEAVIVQDATATELKTENTKENNAESYNEMLKLLENSDLILNTEEFDCPVCFCPVPAKDGIVLRECLHSFCKECLIGSIQYADEPQVKCPYRDDKYSCNSLILEREIKALVPPEIFERHLAKSVKIAEGKIANTFHCRTADCAGWCVFEDDVNVFLCPVCRIRNCLTCQAIHEGMDCQQYQRQLAIDSETDENAKSSRLMLEKMIQRGEALECPACHVVLLKKWGCDWVRCSYCKTEICWITKGFRWGPNGKGDTSGGCKCGVNGVRCHPKCTYCH